MEEAQKTMNEQKQLKRLHYKHGKLQLKLKTIQLTGKKRTKSSFCRKREVYRRYFIPAYNAYIKGDEFNDFTSYETYKQKTIKALNTKIEDLKTQLAEETELLKEFQAAETDQEKEELINGAGNDYTTQQIEQLEREITALKEEITEYQANVDRLQTAIDAAEDALAE